MKRKRNANEGSIFKRTDGRWCGSVSLGWKDGKRRRRCYYGPTAEDVRKKITEAQSSIDKGEELIDDTTILGDFADKWLDAIAPDVKPRTLASYRELLALHIRPTLGRTKLRDVTRAGVKALLLEKRKAGLAKNTVRLIRACLSVMFADAVDDSLVSTNPAMGLSRRRGSKRGDSISTTERVKAIRPFSESELFMFLSAAENDSEYYTLFLLLARAGVRPGEALALQWNDLDFGEREILVERALSAGKIGTTKTGNTRRVDMSLELSAALRKLYVEREKQKLKDGWPEIPEWVFINSVGKPLEISRTKRFARAMKAAGLSGHRLYDLRHTFATLLIAKGTPITYVAAQLGHAKPTTTLQWYAHWLPNSQKTYVDALDRKPDLSKPEETPATAVNS